MGYAGNYEPNFIVPSLISTVAMKEGAKKDPVRIARATPQPPHATRCPAAMLLLLLLLLLLRGTRPSGAGPQRARG